MIARGVVLWTGLVTAFTGPAFAQGRTVSGTVRDSVTGAPVEAARVGVRSQTTVTGTNTAGQFTLSDVPAGAAVIQIRAVGYRRRDVPLSAGDNTLTISLAKDVF